MKIVRSTKCSLKFATKSKQLELQNILQEYGRVVNIFIAHFWKHGIVSKSQLLKPIVDIPKDSWLSARFRQVAAREAIDMVNSVKKVFDFNKRQMMDSVKDIESVLNKLKPDNRRYRRKIDRLHCVLKSKKMRLVYFKPLMPKHNGKSMSVSCGIADLQKVNKARGFDAWLHLASMGKKISLDIPIKFHKHFKNLAKKGTRLNSYIITKDSVQFAFEIETGVKKQVNKILGVDTGIAALASLSTGEQLGTDISKCIDRTKRCQYGSKGHSKAIKALKQRIDEVAKQVVSKTDLVVVEKLKGICSNTKLKGRLSSNVRSSIGRWNQRYWLKRLQEGCEWNRASFRTVSPCNTSITCSRCGNVDRVNRLSQEIFQCSVCCHTENADINAAKNILNRFITGKYGSCYKALAMAQMTI